jgi:hypothetical protein
LEGLLHFGQTALGMIRDVLPIAAILIGFQLFILRRPIHNPMRVGVGLIMVLLGLALFLEGLELALFPLGRLMANQLTAPSFLFGPGADAVAAFEWSDYLWVYLFAGAIGFATTVAEPALIAVSIKANQVSGGTITVNGLRFAVAVGVALGVSLGAFRIVTGTPLHWYIITGYVIVILQTAVAPRAIIPETIPGRSALLDGFGLIAFASLFPMITVMAYAQISEWRTRRARAEQRYSDDST